MYRIHYYDIDDRRDIKEVFKRWSLARQRWNELNSLVRCGEHITQLEFVGPKPIELT